MDNMDIWNALRTPPKEALKKITGGRLKGFTDVSPQWRYKAMTEQFGACGVGWKYTIEKLWLEPVADEVCAFAQVNLSVSHNSKWGEPIPGVGGSMIVAKEKSGPHVSDECYKMAITDALSVALKMLGVAADVYSGLFDGSNDKPPQGTQWKSPDKPPAQTATTKAPAPKTTKAPGLKNTGELMARAAKFGISSRDVCEAVGVGRREDIIDFDEAWVATAKKFASTIKSAQEASK